MAKKISAILLLIAMAALFVKLTGAFTSSQELNETASYYAENTADEVGTANIVTAIVVTYRGLDTLGEVTILFLTAAIVAFLLKTVPGLEKREVRPASELLKTATGIIAPLIFVLGAYIFINGHLTPGGGFQGGAVIASGLILLLLAKPESKAGTALFNAVESVSGLAYVGLGIAGLVLIGKGGFLANRILPLGKVGELVSAGAVPVIYILIGLKVGSELSNLLAKFHGIQEDK